MPSSFSFLFVILHQFFLWFPLYLLLLLTFFFPLPIPPPLSPPFCPTFSVFDFQFVIFLNLLNFFLILLLLLHPFSFFFLHSLSSPPSVYFNRQDISVSKKKCQDCCLCFIYMRCGSIFPIFDFKGTSASAPSFSFPSSVYPSSSLSSFFVFIVFLFLFSSFFLLHLFPTSFFPPFCLLFIYLSPNYLLNLLSLQGGHVYWKFGRFFPSLWKISEILWLLYFANMRCWSVFPQL